MGAGGPELSLSLKQDLIPQKEDLNAISQIPSLVLAGIDDSKKIADHFGQVPRHGRFLLNSCRILGWMDRNNLTNEGLKIASVEPKKRKELTIKAVKNTAIFKLLEKKIR